MNHFYRGKWVYEAKLSSWLQPPKVICLVKGGVEQGGEVQENDRERKCNRCTQLLSLGNTDKGEVPKAPKQKQSWLIEKVRKWIGGAGDANAGSEGALSSSKKACHWPGTSCEHEDSLGLALR